jgi:hypothetical protein
MSTFKNPKCEHIEVSTNFSFQIQFLQFVWISCNKIYSKTSIFHTLTLKIMKLTILNLTHRGVFDNTKNTPNSSIVFSFDFI